MKELVTNAEQTKYRKTGGEKNGTQIRFIPAQINDILLICQKMTGAGCGHGNVKFDWCPATHNMHMQNCVFSVGVQEGVFLFLKVIRGTHVCG